MFQINVRDLWIANTYFEHQAASWLKNRPTSHSPLHFWAECGTNIERKPAWAAWHAAMDAFKMKTLCSKQAILCKLCVNLSFSVVIFSGLWETRNALIIIKWGNFVKVTEKVPIESRNCTAYSQFQCIEANWYCLNFNNWKKWILTIIAFIDFAVR